MTEVAKKFSFATTAENWAGTPYSADIALTYDHATGNPVGALKSRCYGRSKGGGTSYWQRSGTWEQMGVPAGATVTAIRLSGANYRCTEFTVGGNGNTAGPWEVYTSDGLTLIASLAVGVGFTGTHGTWQSASGTDQSVGAAYQASSTSIKLRVSNYLKNGNNGSAAVSLHDDEVEVTITYTVPSTDRKGQVSWAELEAPNAPRRGRLSWVEFETPDVNLDRQARVSWAELETPTAPRRARVSWSELETPTAPRRGELSWCEFETPDAPITECVGRVSWTEFEVPGVGGVVMSSGLMNVTVVKYADPSLIPPNLRRVALITGSNGRAKKVKVRAVPDSTAAPSNEVVYGAVEYATADTAPQDMLRIVDG